MKIGFKPSYLDNDTEVAPDAPPMQQHVVEGKEKNGVLNEAEERLMAAKTFLLSPAYGRMTTKNKGRKIADVEFLTLVVAQLSSL